MRTSQLFIVFLACSVRNKPTKRTVHRKSKHFLRCLIELSCSSVLIVLLSRKHLVSREQPNFVSEITKISLFMTSQRCFHVTCAVCSRITDSQSWQQAESISEIFLIAQSILLENICITRKSELDFSAMFTALYNSAVHKRHRSRQHALGYL